MRIVPPDVQSTRVRFADWLEILALTSDSKRVPIAALKDVRRIELDDRAPATDIDADLEEAGDPEITDRLGSELDDRVVEELDFRKTKLGPAYPFELVGGHKSEPIVLRLREGWNTPGEGKLFYTFCLLDSAIRGKLISADQRIAEEARLVREIGKVFQICACLAIGGYLGLEVVSFGFPRASGDDFLPALRNVWQRYGSFDVRTNIPHGFDDKLKDGGVDIIAWRHFHDRYAATVLMFVQVASGLDWKDKEVGGDVRSIRNWFEGTSFEHFTPAICIPFPLWFDLDEPPRGSTGNAEPFYTSVARRFIFREKKFGVIFDRGRIACESGEAVKRLPDIQPPVDGTELIAEVQAWVNAAVQFLAERRAAA